jgi:hypothetical protein
MDFTLKTLFFVLPLFVLIAAAEGWYLQARRGRDYTHNPVRIAFHAWWAMLCASCALRAACATSR